MGTDRSLLSGDMALLVLELLREGDAGYPAYLAALEDLFGQFSQNGLLLQPNETLVYAGAPAVEAPERSTY